MHDLLSVLMMFNLHACLFTAIYWGYRKADGLLAQLQNCTTLISRASALKGGGPMAKLNLMGLICIVVTLPKLMARSEVVSMEDIEKLPRIEKIKLAILFWTVWGTLAAMACEWAVSELLEYFYSP